MFIVERILVINLAILALYYIGVSLMDGYHAEIMEAALLGAIFIPIHFMTCLIKGVNMYTSAEGKTEEGKIRARAYLFSALVVLIVGFSVCWLKVA